MGVYQPAGPANPDRIVLHSGKPDFNKGIVGCLGVLGVFGAVGLGFVSAVLTSFWLESTGAPVIVGILIALAGSAPFVGFFVGILRERAWLDGTTVVVRGMMSTRRCDLAAAVELEIDTLPLSSPGNTLGYRVPILSARDPATGQWTRIPLHDPKTQKLLAPLLLYALAEAIAFGRRPEPYARRAWQISDGLRSMADNPFANLL